MSWCWPHGASISWSSSNLKGESGSSYAAAVKLVGETTDLLNNMGYAYMLRGNYVAARKKFVQALRRDPQNPAILNNLWLLDASAHALGRSLDVDRR